MPGSPSISSRSCSDYLGLSWARGRQGVRRAIYLWPDRPRQISIARLNALSHEFAIDESRLQ
jgi:hypothetical protein